MERLEKQEPGEETKCTCKKNDPYCCQVHGTCPTCVKQEELKTNLERLPFLELIKEFAEYYKKVPLVGEHKQETLEEAGKDFIENTIRYSFNSDETKTFANRLLKCVEFGAEWQQEQDNKELAMWKLAVEKQEARCTSLRGVISDLQDKNKYSEEDMKQFGLYLGDNLKKLKNKSIDEIFEQFKNI
jgi:hypothetical protein